MHKLLINCLKKKKSSVNTPIYEENSHYRNISSEDFINNLEKNELENETFILEKRIINMCNRWKIRRSDAIQLINIVESQQS